jgi:hypothetical protein
MDYTPQQLMGGASFHPRVRIGNWSEDLELEEVNIITVVNTTHY